MIGKSNICYLLFDFRAICATFVFAIPYYIYNALQVRLFDSIKSLNPQIAYQKYLKKLNSYNRLAQASHLILSRVQNEIC